MKIKTVLIMAFAAVVIPAAGFAHTGTVTFKGGCKVANSGSCTISVSGVSGSVKLYAATAANGHFGAVSNAFTAPGTKRIANSSNNVCFYARPVDSTDRTTIKCLAH